MSVTPDFPASLTGDQRNAASALMALFDSYGLGSLAPKIIEFLQAGESQDTITLQLQQTPEYKQRFAANDARAKKGLPVLSPAEYISTENAYRSVMQSAGLPVGFYDSNTDFQKFLESDVSPTEVQQRVQVAQDAIYTLDPNQLKAAQDYYGVGNIVAHALDPTVAAPLLQKQIRAAQIGGAAADNGLTLGGDLAERLSAAGVTANQAQQGFGQIGQSLPTVSKLGEIYGQSYGVEDATKDTFLNDAAASQKRKGLASQERAAFSGSGGATNRSLGNGSGGAI